ncbi:HzsA-related protein [Pontiella desulfatans]|nr:hypothetical protein [Pontiella desulfatans]
MISILASAAIAYSATGSKMNKIPAPPPLTDLFNPAAARKLIANGVNKLAFIKRNTLDANHFYTEYVNSTWKPGGNICILDLKTGTARELMPEFSEGVFNRFDVSFDAKKIIFDYKKIHAEGYRIYEINVDGTGLRQLTFPQANEAALVKSYGNRQYHHGTDDMHPCYLPDGSIAFVSTRCQYSILCDSGDVFSTKVLYRMDKDGKGMRALSNNPVSEASPTLMPDGRILYHRWEYNDKAAGNAKCLWSMRTDGSGSAEVYGNTLTYPETLIYGRAIPGAPGKILSLACSHWGPNNAMGTVVVIDTTKNIRTREPLTYITKDVDAQAHSGFHFLIDGQWIHDKTGLPGRLFKDPYPISETLFMASLKPKGYRWNDVAAYDLCLLDANGETTPLYQDKSISCWHAMPLAPRTKPPVAEGSIDPALAKKGKAVCVVADVYHGMPEVERGAVKYLRVMEQVSRPWTVRNRWPNDRSGMAHSAIGIGRLGLKVQHGIVPVEKDGSAHFEVPAERNIYFQALDENHMAVQTERTYINYIPGETRSCVGCHELPGEVPPASTGFATPLALQRVPSQMRPQPGDSSPQKTINYLTQVQPVWDKHCIECHGAVDPKGGLNLTGAPTKLWTVSYEALMNSRNPRLGIPYAGEYMSANEDKGSADISYRNAYHSGSHTSPLVTVIGNGRIPLRHPDADAIARRLVNPHRNIRLTQAEFVSVVNWLDAFGQFYPSYWGLKNAAHEGHEFFRPDVGFEDAINREIPATFAPLYDNPPKQPKTTARSK